MLAPICHLSDPSSQNIACQKSGSWRKAGSSDSINPVMGRHVPVEDFLQWSLMATLASRWFTCPTWKKLQVLEVSKTMERPKTILGANSPTANSGVFWDNSLTPGIKESAIYIWTSIWNHYCIHRKCRECSKIRNGNNFSIVSYKGPRTLVRLWFPLL